jgi:hypothetical protein
MVPRSHARVTRFLDDKDSNIDDDEEEEDEDEGEDEDEDKGKKRAGLNKDGSVEQVQLKAPNFNVPPLSSDDEDSFTVKPSKSPAPPLQPADFEVGWSTPGHPSSQQTTVCQIFKNARIFTKL